METTLDILEILKALPHRYPFLLIDRVLEIVPGERLKAIKNVTANEPFFQGHFPDLPVMPGVLILEALAQAACILGEKSSFQKSGEILFFAGLDKVRFRRPVVPGDQIILEVKFLKLKSRIAKLAGTATVDDVLVAEAELMASKGGK